MKTLNNYKANEVVKRIQKTVINNKFTDFAPFVDLAGNLLYQRANVRNSFPNTKKRKQHSFSQLEVSWKKHEENMTDCEILWNFMNYKYEI